MISAKSDSVVGTDGQTTSALNINLQEAPVPDRRYVADFAALIYKNDIVKLIFGQEKLGSSDIRSLVVIVMHTQDAQLMLQSIQSLSAPSLDGLVAIAGIKATDLFPVSNEPEQTIALAANLVAIAVSGSAACLDFYNASAFSISNLLKTQKLAVDPVARIDLPTSYLVALRNALVEMETSFPPPIPGDNL